MAVSFLHFIFSIDFRTLVEQSCISLESQDCRPRVAEFNLIVLNGNVVTADVAGDFNIAVEDGKAVRVISKGTLAGLKTKKLIHAEGGMVMPVGVDAHVHLGEPALLGKGETAHNYETGTRLVVAEGTTTLISFAPLRKSEPSHLAALEPTQVKAAGECYLDYAFHLVCSSAGRFAISQFAVFREAGISSLKIYVPCEALQLSNSEILDVLFEAHA